MTTRRPRVWSDILYRVLTIASGGESVLSLGTELEDSDTKTIVRLIVDLQASLDEVSEVETTQLITMGVGVASDTAFGVGITALPSPESVADYPREGWLYRSAKPVLQTLPTGGTPTAMWRDSPQFQVDLRAARKVDRGVAYVHIKNEAFGGTASIVRIAGIVRALWLL